MKFLTLILLLFIPLSAHANPSLESSYNDAKDELSQIEELVSITEERLTLLQALEARTKEYRKIEKECLKKPNDTALLYKLADIGKELFESIQKAGVADYLSPNFVKDLEKLSNIANKQSIPPVR